nr:rod-binding protein [Campylobacter sp.]
MMIDNTLAINAYSASKIDALTARNASVRNSRLDFASELDLVLEKSTKPSAEFKASFKEQKELVNGIDTKALREQTDAFESFFVKMVLDIAIKTENPLFGKDAGDEIYGSMYRQTMSEALSGGFGFSDMIYDYLLERAK